MRVVCAGCKAKGDGNEAVTYLAVGSRAWELCATHADSFAQLLADALQDQGRAEPLPPPAPPKNVVVTGDVPRYAADEARLALSNAGYEISGHVDEHTEFIVIGLRPAPHKIAEAREAGLQWLDATRPGVFSGAVKAGSWPESLSDSGTLPDVPAKKTALHVRAEVTSQPSPKPRLTAVKDPVEATGEARQDNVHESPPAPVDEVAAKQKRAVEAAAEWRDEVNRRLGASRVEAAKERREKESRDRVTRAVREHKREEKSQPARVRSWAAAQGYEVARRGRIPAAVQNAYEYAHAA